MVPESSSQVAAPTWLRHTGFASWLLVGAWVAGALFGMVGLTLAAPLTSAAMHISNELRGRSNEPVVAEVAPAPSG